jgi:nicotinate-nucleotide adenylyltransferase
MKVGILGGSFDPPHFGHLLLARQTREIFGLDEVWLMPYFAHSWDPTLSPAEDRLAMARLIEEPGIVVSEEETGEKAVNYTIDTVRRLKAKHKHEFFWIVGSDILDEFERWKDHEVLSREVPFLVFPRNGYPASSSLPPGFRLIDSHDIITSNISSTIVRKRLQKQHSVVGLVPESVLAYISKHKLYDTR